MRNLVFSGLLLLVTIVGCTSKENAAPTSTDVQPVSFNVEGRPTIEIDVPGLHCENCSATACNLLAEVPGVVDVKADPETKKATLAIDEAEFDSEAARAALEEQFGEATVVDEQVSTDMEPTAEKS